MAETLRDRLARAFHHELDVWGTTGNHMAEFAADRIARLVEGGWLRHLEDCAVTDASMPLRTLDWIYGDESACTCGLAEALGLKEEGR